MPNNTTTGNTGEWSELYALVFILTYGGLFGADKEQNKKTDIFYKVVEVFLEGKSKETTIQYIIAENYIEIYNQNNLLGEINISDLKTRLKEFFIDLSSQNDGRAYSLESGSALLELLQRKGIKASSRKKKDIDLIILDSLSKMPSPLLGFSIKSQLGTASTLLNASKATNFVYEILDETGNIPTDLPILHDKNVKDNICLLTESGYKIVFRKIESTTFEKNIGLIDSNLAKSIATIMLSYYSRSGTKIADLTKIEYPENDQVKHKIKEFIAIMALGMMPNTEWDGILTTLGGIILVKKDGDVLCYYLYNLKDFQDYLFENVKFDTPSTTRYGIGKIIKEGGKVYIKLNLQIRFLR